MQLWKSNFLRYFSKAKTEKCDHKVLSLSDKYGMIMSSLDTYFPEVSDNALLKVTTKSSWRGKKYRNFLQHSENFL